MSDALLVTARLATPLAGDAPQLDALCEYLLSLHHGKGEPGYKVDRAFPAPPMAAIPIPMVRRDAGPWKVAACSDPIYPEVARDGREFVNKRLATEEAGLLAPRARTVVSTTNSWTKSYRIPLRVRRIDRVRWFAAGHRRPLLKLLQRCTAIGKKVSVGYGRVAEWTIERVERDYSWYAAWEGHGTVLMRALPVGPWLPKDLIGYREDFGACVPPLWHPDRYCPIVRPV